MTEKNTAKLLYRYTATLGVCALLAACSSGSEVGPVCYAPSTCTYAPVKATSRPYVIKGVTYYPQPHYEYDEVGMASYYGGERKGRYQFHGRKTATGATFDMNEVSAAHKTLPLPCIAEVSNLENGRQILVTVNDRGPYVEGRIIDMSRRAAQLLGFHQRGTARVRVRTLVAESLALNGIGNPTMMMAPPTVPMTPAAAPMFVAVAPEVPPAVSSPSPVVEAPAKTAPSTGIFVDVGHHATQEEALQLAQQMAEAGDAPKRPVRSKGSAAYAVRVGPLASLSAADQLLDKLTAAGRLSRIIIQR